MLQERTVSRTLGKNYQTKPPAFTESTDDPAAPSLRPCPPCVLPAASTAFFSAAIDRAVHRSRKRSFRQGREEKVIAARGMVLKRKRSGISRCIRSLFHLVLSRSFADSDSFEGILRVRFALLSSNTVASRASMQMFCG